MSRDYFFLLAPALLLAACAANLHEDTEASDGALHQTVGRERACAAVNAYEEAKLEDFDVPSRSDLPAKVASLSEDDISHFTVSGVGDVFVVDIDDSTTALYNRSGKLLAQGTPSTGAWSTGTGPLSCGSSGAIDAGTEAGYWSSSSSSSGWWGGDDAGDGGSPWIPTEPEPIDGSDAGDGG